MPSDKHSVVTFSCFLGIVLSEYKNECLCQTSAYTGSWVGCHITQHDVSVRTCPNCIFRELASFFFLRVVLSFNIMGISFSIKQIEQSLQCASECIHPFFYLDVLSNQFVSQILEINSLYSRGDLILNYPSLTL